MYRLDSNKRITYKNKHTHTHNSNQFDELQKKSYFDHRSYYAHHCHSWQVQVCFAKVLFQPVPCMDIIYSYFIHTLNQYELFLKQLLDSNVADMSSEKLFDMCRISEFSKYYLISILIFFNAQN